MATIKGKNASITLDGKAFPNVDLYTEATSSLRGEDTGTVQAEELTDLGVKDYEINVMGFYEPDGPVEELMGITDKPPHTDIRLNPGRMPYNRLAKMANWLNRKIGRYTFHWGLWKSCEYILPNALLEHGETRDEDGATVVEMKFTGVPIKRNVAIGPWWFLDWWDAQRQPVAEKKEERDEDDDE